jgi:hypothetical protein
MNRILAREEGKHTGDFLGLRDGHAVELVPTQF